MGIEDRVAEALGLASVRVEPAAGGAGHDAFLVYDGDRPIAFLRTETAVDTDQRQSRYGLAREARILRHVAKLGFPVADVLAETTAPTGLLMNIVPGSSRPAVDEIERVAPEYLALVAKVHQMDPEGMPIEAFATMLDAVTDELDWWQAMAVGDGVAERPLMRLAHHVLRRTVPPLPERPAVVHGDIGPGNFMIDGGHVAAMLDWEMAHLGDPVEDLAWLWMRGAHTDFGDPATRFAEYERAAGAPIDRRRLDWQVGVVMWKSCTATEAMLANWPPSETQLLRAVVALTYDALIGSQLVHLLSGGLTLLAEEPERARTLGSHLTDVALTSGTSRVAELCLEYVRTAAEQSAWERRRFAEDAAALGCAPDAVTGPLDDLDDAELLALTTLYARAADRAAQAMPKSVRRIQRAQRIGLGIDRTHPTTEAP
jgi:aminoglycoside phosphotransferase (APT) family kinase protein